VSITEAFEIGGSEHRSSVGVSRRTVTGTVSSSVRASLKLLLFGTARNQRVCAILPGLYCQWVPTPGGAVAGGDIIWQSSCDDGLYYAGRMLRSRCVHGSRSWRRHIAHERRPGTHRSVLLPLIWTALSLRAPTAECSLLPTSAGRERIDPYSFRLSEPLLA
jgi:hypothetical protein